MSRLKVYDELTETWIYVGGVDPTALAADPAFSGRYVPVMAASNMRRLVAKLVRNVEDCSILVVGDSTGNETTEWVYLMAQHLATSFPTHTVTYRIWDTVGDVAYVAPVTVQTGSGGRTLAVYNASVAGTSCGYFLGARWPAGISAADPDLMFVSHGHNVGDPTITVYARDIIHGIYLGLTEELAHRFPRAGMVLIAQNPTTVVGRETWQAIKASVVETIAAVRGYGFVDVHQAIVDTGSIATYLNVDGIHPNTAGTAIWANLVNAALDAARYAPSLAQQIPVLDVAARNLIGTAYDFSDWSGTDPAGWTPTLCTTSKDVTNYETGLQACKITAGAAGNAFLQWGGTLSTLGIKGLGSDCVLVVAARMYVPAANVDTARLTLQDTLGGAAASASDVSATTRDRYHWIVVARKIASTNTQVFIKLHPRTSGANTPTISVDRVYLTVGALPRCG